MSVFVFKNIFWCLLKIFTLSLNTSQSEVTPDFSADLTSKSDGIILQRRDAIVGPYQEIFGRIGNRIFEQNCQDVRTEELSLFIESVSTAYRTFAKHQRYNYLLQCISRIWISLTWIKFVIRRLVLIFTTAPAASTKNYAEFDSDQN